MTLEIDERMILAEWLFVETLDDIHRRSTEPERRTRYELLGIAPLLRKLLIDDTPLVHTVRSTRRDVPVEFRIHPWNEPEDRLANEGLPRYFGIGDERIVGGSDSPTAGLKQFLSSVVGVAQDTQLTARGVIRYYAHVEGGVHFGVPKEAGEQTMMTMSPMLLGHSTGQVQILAHLGRIVADAMEPMRRAILSAPTIHTLLHHKDDRGLFMNHWTTEYLERRGLA